jgi:SAM-dependent methyltransferase
MKKNTNVENWIDYWNSAKGFFSNTSDMEQAESWNEKWGQMQTGKLKMNMAHKKRNRVQEIFEMLDEAGFRINGSRILDIGCGPGAFSIPFAKAGAKVTALDISKTALIRLQADAKKEGVSIETIESSWWSVDIDKLGLRNKFDLVFVTSTPAIKDADCLNSMMSCSKKYCYYSFFIRHTGHTPWHYEEILAKILKKEVSRNAPGRDSVFVNIFIYLYLLGYRPIIRVIHNRKKIGITWEKAAEAMIKFLERTLSCPQSTRKKIMEYYRASAKEGKHKELLDGYTGMMVWKVKKQQLPAKQK